MWSPSPPIDQLCAPHWNQDILVGPKFVLPQCSAPRRRYAKAVGDQWGITNDGGDFPIYAMTFAGLVLTTWFSLVVVPSL